MILIMKKTNIILGSLILAFTLAIIGINIVVGNEPSDNKTIEVNTIPTLITVGKTVVVDAGHGGEDPGAVSKFSGACEKNITLQIADSTRLLLEKAGYTVIMTRTEDTLVYEGDNLSMTAKRRQDLLRRKKIMDESGADIVISIHLNAFTDKKYSGAQAFYTKESLSSKKLAICLQDSMRAFLDENNKREAILKADDIIITKDCKVTTVLLECGFLSNEDEEKKLIDPNYQQKIAEAIKAGVDAYFTVEVPEKK
ncbi:MAG: N-acetylmuramoyl-L-alanine amidase [Clostridia bacterium]|nr:N-acetylmuramoyl-L-alanine amidase [Clostridia bacterium]